VLLCQACSCLPSLALYQPTRGDRAAAAVWQAADHEAARSRVSEPGESAGASSVIARVLACGGAVAAGQ